MLVEDAERGRIGGLDPAVVTAADGRVVWDNAAYSFIQGDAPSCVNPSLWRQATLVAMHGLYEVVEGIYQVRGLDLSNVTFVEGEVSERVDLSAYGMPTVQVKVRMTTQDAQTILTGSADVELPY